MAGTESDPIFVIRQTNSLKSKPRSSSHQMLHEERDRYIFSTNNYLFFCRNMCIMENCWDGTGTVETPYLIQSAEDLLKFAEAVNS
ncbi:MAG: hypothetical protein O0V67_02155, partial [Methanocorpusculum sp.]|nr:hypothetical protein [Methanocorpusculum sp.]